MSVLAENILVQDPQTGAVRSFLAGEEPPEWVYDLVTNPAVWEGGAAPQKSGAPPRDPSGPPPLGGPGSGREAWAAYAQSNGVIFAEGAARDDIVAACQTAGIPTA